MDNTPKIHNGMTDKNTYVGQYACRKKILKVR